MKLFNFKYTLLVLGTFLLFGCEENGINTDNNPCLIDKPVSYTLNLNLPQYADLQIAGTSLMITDSSNFIKGVYIFFSGNQYTVLELSEPNHCQSVCNTLPSITNGQFVYSCPSGIVKVYNILGSPLDSSQNPYPMRNYQAVLTENILTIRY